LDIDGGLDNSNEDVITNSDSTATEESGLPESMDNEEDSDNQSDDLDDRGRNSDDAESNQSSPLSRINIHLPQPGPLKGYEYTAFNPSSMNHRSTAYLLHPTQSDVLAAIEDLNQILHPSRNTGRGQKDSEIDLWQINGEPPHARQQLEWAEEHIAPGGSVS